MNKLQIIYSLFVFFLCSYLFGADDDNWKIRGGVFSTESEINISVFPDRVSEELNEFFPGYIDGFVKEDDSGNIGGRTGNWGYQSEEQITARPDYVRYQKIEGAELKQGYASAGKRFKNQGVFLEFGRILDEESNWLFQGKLHFFRKDIRMHNTLRYNTVGTYYDYPLDGVVPPEAPYEGRYVQTPGVPRLGVDPEKTPYSGGEEFTQLQDLNFESTVLDLSISLARKLIEIDRFIFLIQAGGGVEMSRIKIEFQNQANVLGTNIINEKDVFNHSAIYDYYVFGGLKMSYYLSEEKQWRFSLGLDYRMGLDDLNIMNNHVNLSKREVRYHFGFGKAF